MKEGLATYNTMQGDMWDIVAKKYTGDEKDFLSIVMANPEYGNYLVFPASIKLIIPEIESKKVEGLPPWKR